MKTFIISLLLAEIAVLAYTIHTKFTDDPNICNSVTRTDCVYSYLPQTNF